MIIVRDGNVPGWEEDMFDSINGLPEWLYPAVWPFQQLGALVIGPVVALVAAADPSIPLGGRRAARDQRRSSLLEDVVKAMVSRERPGTSIGADIEMRGDVSVQRRELRLGPRHARGRPRRGRRALSLRPLEVVPWVSSHS